MHRVLSWYTIEVRWYRRHVGTARRMGRIDRYNWSITEPRHA